MLASGQLRPGDLLPTVRALAEAAGVNQNTVLRAYALLREDGILEGHNRQGTRVRATARGAAFAQQRSAELQVLVARMIGEAVARGHAVEEIEAAFEAQRAAWLPMATRTADLAQRWIGLGSHDLCLDLLLSRLQMVLPGCSFSFAPVGSTAGLIALSRGEVHFATAHLLDPRTGDCNLPFVRECFGDRRMALVTLAHRAQGLMVAPGNPKRVRTVRDLTRRGVRFVNRQVGAGTRALLDSLLVAEGIATEAVRGYADVAPTHVDVAARIARGEADAGLGIQAAAQACGLDFVPITRERFEWVMPADGPLLPHLSRILASTEFAESAHRLGGYDLAECGRIRYSGPHLPKRRP